LKALDQRAVAEAQPGVADLDLGQVEIVRVASLAHTRGSNLLDPMNYCS